MDGGSSTDWRNWVKVYDNASVLRVETTINNPREFRILRVFKDAKGRSERRWCPMNKGVANFWRYFQVGMASNRRYLTALAAAPSQRQRSRRARRLVPAAHQTRASPRPLRSATPSRPSPLPGRAHRRERHRRLPKRRPRRPPLSPPALRSNRSSSPLRPSITSHSQAPRSWIGRQSPTPTPLPTHPPRTANPHRRHLHPRPPIPRRLPRRSLKNQHRHAATRKSLTVV